VIKPAAQMVSSGLISAIVCLYRAVCWPRRGVRGSQQAIFSFQCRRVVGLALDEDDDGSLDLMRE
jgi:hypothetical protein